MCLGWGRSKEGLLGKWYGFRNNDLETIIITQMKDDDIFIQRAMGKVEEGNGLWSVKIQDVFKKVKFTRMARYIGKGS